MGFGLCVHGAAAGRVTIKCVCYHMVSLLFRVFCAVLLGVLLLLAWRFVQATIPVQPVVAAANPLQRQPARADPCTLHLVLVPVHIPSTAKMGHVPSCSRLGLVFGHQQASHGRAVRLPAGLDTNLLQGPQPPFGSCTNEVVYVRCLSKRHSMSYLPFSPQGSLIQRLPPMERGNIQSEITDN